ncbi:hypothetical protein DdX_21571 [Ditylenchus destructor]|uniref:Uncharacterized protein n=1 Tax=Ditylenchus destructor TaxID=166010 RepID=A0AAD4QVF8_9BILA|nr:hypothetical protein DdX_21571 [Ditylenchus destructor]
MGQNISLRCVKRHRAKSSRDQNRGNVNISDDTWLEALKFLTCPQWLQKRFVCRQINGIAERNITRLPKMVLDYVGMDYVDENLDKEVLTIKKEKEDGFKEALKSSVDFLKNLEMKKEGEAQQRNLTADGGARSDEEPNLPNNSRSTIFTTDIMGQNISLRCVKRHRAKSSRDQNRGNVNITGYFGRYLAGGSKIPHLSSMVAKTFCLPSNQWNRRAQHYMSAQDGVTLNVVFKELLED